MNPRAEFLTPFLFWNCVRTPQKGDRIYGPETKTIERGPNATIERCKASSLVENARGVLLHMGAYEKRKKGWRCGSKL